MSHAVLAPWRVITRRPRLFAGVVVGMAVWPLLPGGLAQVTRGLMAWDVGVLTYLILAIILFATAPADHIAAGAAAQREGEWTIFWLTLGAALASFTAIFNQFSAMKDLPPGQRSLHVALVAMTLLASWLMTHITFTFRYAHEYYGTDPRHAGGMRFPGEKSPDYLDFLYFSLGLGTTFQVSDVEILARRIRHLAMVHGLMSFLFNTVILALTVNLAAGLM
jgi:uncharacterized membrane protein